MVKINIINGQRGCGVQWWEEDCSMMEEEEKESY